MKRSRIVVAGIVAGIIVFIWGMLSHVVLGFGQMGVKPLPNETAVLESLKQNISEAGFYIFPGGMESIQDAPKEEQESLTKQYEETYKTQPHGVLIIKPGDGTFYSFPKLLLGELFSNVLGALIAAWLYTLALPSLRSMTSKVLFGAALGIFSILAIEFSYWNWYDFPTEYLFGMLLDATIAWGIAGLVFAWLIRDQSSVSSKQ